MLRYILAEIASQCGTSLPVTTEKSWLIDQVNKAAFELYTKRDLNWCEREQVFQMDSDQQVVALPSYVGEIRGSRTYHSRAPLTIHDLRPRYKSNGWTEDMTALRLKGKFPIKRNILNAAPVTLTIPSAETADFSVIISGSTVNAERVTETITFSAGQTSKQSVNAFSNITDFGNVAAHSYDVTMADVDGNELSVLPNVARKVQYHWVQALDYAIVAESSPYVVEVLYKMVWYPMVNDYDEFLCPGYDDAIVWQTLGNLLADREPEKSALAFTKVGMILKESSGDAKQAVQESIDFLPNRTLGLFDGWGSGQPMWSGPMFPGAY